MNTSKLIIVGIVFSMILTVGVKLGRWAEAESKATEAGYRNAMSIIMEK